MARADWPNFDDLLDGCNERNIPGILVLTSDAIALRLAVSER
jgi:hypothetical protein